MNFYALTTEQVFEIMINNKMKRKIMTSQWTSLQTAFQLEQELLQLVLVYVLYKTKFPKFLGRLQCWCIQSELCISLLLLFFFVGHSGIDHLCHVEKTQLLKWELLLALEVKQQGPLHHKRQKQEHLLLGELFLFSRKKKE